MERAFRELTELCSGESLSLTTLRQKLNASPKGTIRSQKSGEDTLLHHVCYNKRVTLEMVKYLFELYPGAIEQYTDHSSWLPLHRACLNKYCPRDVVEYLVSKYPSALSIPWPHTGLPLHCVLSRMTIDFDDNGNSTREGIPSLDLSLVRALVEAYPEALTNQENDSSSTPLHIACKREDVSLELVQMLVGEELAAIRLVGDYGECLPFPLIFDGPRCPPLELVRFFLENSPDSRHIAARNRLSTPFHAACANKHVTLEVIQLFVQSSSDLLLEREQGSGNLPLHAMCLNDHSSDFSQLAIVKYLVEENPQTVRVFSIYGFLPVHYAAGRSLEVTKFLVDQYPESVKLESLMTGGTPFHAACRSGSFETVKYLFELSPKAIAEKRDFSRDLPLHLALDSRRDTADKISFLIKQYPKAVKEVGDRGSLPLHRACDQFNPDLSIIKSLFDVYPEAIHSRNDKGALLLHSLCSRKPSNETIRFLVTQLPYGIKAKDADGRVPLHYAFQRFSPSLEELRFIIQFHPDAVKVDSPSHGLPIHCACKNQVELDVVKYLVSLYPESLDLFNDSVGLPLHCAESKEVFEYLLQKRYNGTTLPPLHAILQDGNLKDKSIIIERFIGYFPGNARNIDRHGAFPLHLAVAALSKVELINKLISLNPEAVETQNSQGSLPLHNALRHGAPLDVVQCLLQRYSRGAQIVDHLGRTPLHVACQHGSSPEVVEELINVYPQSVRVFDVHGCTPLHVACRHGSSLEAVQSLVNADETTLHLTDERQELPLHKACRGGHIPLVHYLVERNKPSTKMRNSLGLLPVFILCQSSGKSRDTDTPAFIGTIWLLLTVHPEALSRTSQNSASNY